LISLFLLSLAAIVVLRHLALTPSPIASATGVLAVALLGAVVFALLELRRRTLSYRAAESLQAISRLDHAVVRVRSLHLLPTNKRLFAASRSSPKVGDRAAVVEVLAPDTVVVECVEPDGSTDWLAVFNLAELEVLPNK
jgi:hypothetical protein